MFTVLAQSTEGEPIGIHSGPSKRNTQCGSKWVGKYAIRNTQYAMGVKVGWM